MLHFYLYKKKSQAFERKESKHLSSSGRLNMIFLEFTLLFHKKSNESAWPNKSNNKESQNNIVRNRIIFGLLCICITIAELIGNPITHWKSHKWYYGKITNNQKQMHFFLIVMITWINGEIASSRESNGLNINHNISHFCANSSVWFRIV